MSPSHTVIYFNPRCSKCRTTLGLLKERDITPKIIEYLQDIPSKTELEKLLTQLGVSASQLLRKKESVYKESGLNKFSTEDDILNAMTKYPALIERPVIIHNDKAVIGRPPEKILEIL